MTLKVSRRSFLGTSLSAGALSWKIPFKLSEPILDLHQHTSYKRRPHNHLVAHQDFLGVTTTVLLPGEGWMLDQVGGNQSCMEVESRYPGRFVRFACADAAESRAVDVLRKNIEQGAIGIGEMKFHVAVDSAEMNRIYSLAKEMDIPVLIHFLYERYNTGIHRFSKILDRYPTVKFIGHAQTWWGNISADLNPLVAYPTGKIRPGGLTDRLLSDYPNMYGDLSAGSGLNSITRDPDFASGFLERHHRRLIWGSDCDCLDGKGAGVNRGNCIGAESLAILRHLIPDSGKLRRILYENGAKLLGLKSPQNE